MGIRLVCVAALLWASAGSAAAQDRGGDRNAAVVDSLIACRDVAADADRLACFDRTAAALAEATRQKDVVVLDREGMREAKRAVFGFSLPKLKLFGKAGGAEPEVKEIDGTLASVRGFGSGLFVLGLEDGTAWQTLEAQIGLHPRKGDAIHVEAGILGSYKAKIGSRRPLKVKRVR